MLDGDTLAVIKVRRRSRGDYASAAEVSTGTKQQRLLRATRHLLTRRPQLDERASRFDVVAFSGDDTPNGFVTHSASRRGSWRQQQWTFRLA